MKVNVNINNNPPRCPDLKAERRGHFRAGHFPPAAAAFMPLDPERGFNTEK